MTVIPMRPRRKTAEPAPKPAVVRENVTQEERAAADDLLRQATALQRLFDRAWVAPAVLAKAPQHLADAEAALAKLRDLIG